MQIKRQDSLTASTGLAERLIQAFHRATYRITWAGKPSLDLHVDERSDDLAALLADAGVSRAAIITGHNPYGQLRAADNPGYEDALRRYLDNGGDHYLETEHITHPDDSWPCERGVLVFGLSPERARLVGTIFGQYAVLTIGPDSTPRLLFLS